MRLFCVPCWEEERRLQINGREAILFVSCSPPEIRGLLRRVVDAATGCRIQAENYNTDGTLAFKGEALDFTPGPVEESVFAIPRGYKIVNVEYK